MSAVRLIQPRWVGAVPGGLTPRVRFASGQQDARVSGEPWRAYQSVLESFIEKGRPLLLPDRDKIPTTLADPLDAALGSVSSGVLSRLKAQKQFGIAEETSDLLYYITTRASLELNILGMERLERFRLQTLPCFANRTEPSYREFKSAALASIQPEDITRLNTAIPLADTPEHRALFREFLAMILMDYATYKQVPRDNGNLSESSQLNAKLTEEGRELIENIQGRTLPSLALVGELQTLLGRFPSNASETAAQVNQLVRLTQPILAMPEFTLPNLLRFALYKSRGRTEFIFTNPNRPYEELKQSAKAWEKILEAALFLTPGK